MRVPSRRWRTGALLALGLASAVSTLAGGSSAAAGPSAAGGQPNVDVLVKAPRSFHGDVRRLPQATFRAKPERIEREVPELKEEPTGEAAPLGAGVAATAAAAPDPLNSFDGLHFTEDCNGDQCGQGHPPDTNGDVGPQYYVQTINVAIGIFNKTTGQRVAAFTFNQLMSQGNFGNLCDTDNFGDPVVLYDTFEDRWIITDFAFLLNPDGSIPNPPGVYQCFAVSKTGDPVTGGWNFYSIQEGNLLGDYEKLAVWPDGIYMTANMFGLSAHGSFQTVRAWAFDKADMYAGEPTVQIVSFDLPAKIQGLTLFSALPSNARVQAGTPPAGSPNYLSMVSGWTNRVRIWKFHVDWGNTANSTLTGPTDSTVSTTLPSPPSEVPEKDGWDLDTLGSRLMMQNQYSNLNGVESLWNTHTVQGSSSSQSAVRYYQVRVTGGTIESNATQGATYNPDSKNRFIPSLAVDRAGNMAIGYSVTDASTYPAIRYAGRLAGDPLNTLSQTETTLIQGTGGQTHLFKDGSEDHRWGDYSSMTLDPDGCTFWYTTEYYVANGGDHHTRIGSFRLPGCSPLVAGTLEGTVTDASSTAPIEGATVTAGGLAATTNATGHYSLASVPVGTYSVTASCSGFGTSTAGGVVVTENHTTIRNFALSAAPTSACLTDTSQSDFEAGTGTNVDAISSPGNVKLVKAAATLDQQQLSSGSAGNTISTKTWEAQSFVPSVSGQLTQVDGNMFCSSCSGANPSITFEIRTTSAGVPTSTVLASSTVPGFSSGTSSFYSATFGSPATLTAGTTYAVVARLTTPRTTGSYAWLRSKNNQYANGAQLISSTSGSSWIAQSTDLVFKTYMALGFAPSGSLVSRTFDANPAAGRVAHWTTLSWNATTPASTGVRFQIAGSSSPSGPFAFVGPDGTAATFFTTSGASLAAFDGVRYL